MSYAATANWILLVTIETTSLEMIYLANQHAGSLGKVRSMIPGGQWSSLVLVYEKCGINKAGACSFRREAFVDQHYGLGVGSLRPAPAVSGLRLSVISTLVLSSHVWWLGVWDW